MIGDDSFEISTTINKNAIELFRKNVNLVDLRDRSDIKMVDAEVKKRFCEREMWSKPIIFQEEEQRIANKFPSEKVSFFVRQDKVWEAWIQILRLITKFGSKKGMIKVGSLKEIVNIIAVIQNEDIENPDLTELNFSKKDLDVYIKNFYSRVNEEGSYSYGERIFSYPAGIPLGNYNSKSNSFKRIGIKNGFVLDQFEEIFEKYQRYHEDRGLLITLSNPWVDNIKNGWMSDKKNISRAGNIPCMSMIQFSYRSKKLNLTAYFRSNDMFDAWPRNCFALRKMQYDFAKRIGKKPGVLTTISNCAHIYESHFKDAEDLVKKYENTLFCLPDPRGAITINIEGSKVIANHLSPDGNEVLKSYSIDANKEKADTILCDKLISDNVFSQLSHASDIAREITKAVWCARNGRHFVQDRDLSELMKNAN